MTAALTPTHWATLETLVDLIIPPDEAPGGLAAGVGTYLEQQFAGSLHTSIDLYRSGLEALEYAAQRRGATSLATLAPAGQVALLQAIEQGDGLDEHEQDLPVFFALVIEHVMEGYYSDPGNGGNRNQVAWHMIGFEVRG